MNFTIGLVLTIAAGILAILAIVFWASSSGTKREEPFGEEGARIQASWSPAAIVCLLTEKRQEYGNGLAS